MIFATSKRCYLRPWLAQDAQALFLLNADDRVMRYTGDSPFKSIGESAEFIAHYQEVYHSTALGRMAIIRKEDKRNLGWCGFKLHAAGQIDLGFRLFHQYWGKGYASESAHACLELASQGNFKDRVVAQAHSDNMNSHRLILRLGFVAEHKAVGIHQEGFKHYVLKL